MQTVENSTDQRLEDIFYGIDWQGFASGIVGEVKNNDKVTPKPQPSLEPKGVGTSFDPFE